MNDSSAADALGAIQEASFATSSRATVTSYPPANRMSGETLADVLTTRRYATVATTRPDGRPHAAPTSFVLSGAALWLPTVEGAVRARNVTVNPYAVLVLSEGEGPAHLAVIAEGPAALEASPPPEADERLGGVPDWASTWIVLRPSRLLSYAADETGLGRGDAEPRTP